MDDEQRHAARLERLARAADIATRVNTPDPPGTEHRRVYSVEYRSLKNGVLWCESSDPEEVKRMSEGEGCTFQKLTVYMVDDGWQPWE